MLKKKKNKIWHGWTSLPIRILNTTYFFLALGFSLICFIAFVSFRLFRYHSSTASSLGNLIAIATIFSDFSYTNVIKHRMSACYKTIKKIKFIWNINLPINFDGSDFFQCSSLILTSLGKLGASTIVMCTPSSKRHTHYTNTQILILMFEQDIWRTLILACFLDNFSFFIC